MWYVVQTKTGKEKELVEVLENVFPGKGFTTCFVPQQECIWRLEGQYIIHVEPLFPSYVFIETDTPEAFFIALKQVPKLTKILGADGIFWNINKEEERLLRNLFGDEEEYVVRRSLVEIDQEGNILSAEGALKNFTDKVVKKRLRKRSVVIEISFLGSIKRIQLGIRLKDDMI